MSTSMLHCVRSKTEKTNYQSCSVLENDVKKWNDYTVRYELSLCTEVLLGVQSHNITGMLKSFGKDQCTIWITRFYTANKEARVRFGDDKDFMEILDDTEFVIDYELV